MNTGKKTFRMVLTALFMAIVIIMAFVPNLGYINLVLIKATLIHVPVIIGSIVLGPQMGAVLGLTFGLTSLINNSISPSVLSFAFSPFYSVGGIGGNFFSIIICFVPRILVGVVPYYVYKGLMALMKKFKARQMVVLPIACVLGSFTNTLLVMNMIYIFFKDEFATAKSIAVEVVYDTILGIIAVNGIPEAIVAVIIGTSISIILLKLFPQLTLNRD